MKTLVIFDLDGTLLNTLDDLAAAANHALAEQELPVHPVEQYKTFVGDGVYKLIERMTPPAQRADTALAARLKEGFDRYYAAHGEELTAPYPGVLDTLDALRERGVICAVLSNKPHEFSVPLCKRFFGDRLRFVHGQRQGYPRKPDRRLVTELLELADAQPEDCLYVGDSGVDMQTAKNAGVFAVGALWGFRTREELEQAGADAFAGSIEEILHLL